MVISLVVSEIFNVISLTGFEVSVTNLNEPPRALAAYTIAWVRAVVNKCNAG